MIIVNPKLWPHQIKVRSEVYQSIKSGNHRVLVVAMTGSGKTMIAASMARDAIAKGMQVISVVNRDPLIPQTMRTLDKWGLTSGVVAGGYEENRAAQVQVCSFQTLAGDRPLDWLWQNPARTLTLIDEAHESSFSRPMRLRFPKLPGQGFEREGYVVGFTATPWRYKPTESLGEIYQDVIFAPQPSEMIASGVTVKPQYYRVPNSDGKNIAADIEYLVREWHKIGQNSPTLAFCPSVEFAKAIAQRFQQEGIGATAVWGNMPKSEERDAFAGFSGDKYKVLASCSKLTEGYDEPKARVGIFAKKSRSRRYAYQALGRILRSHPGKTDAIVLDQVGLFGGRYGFEPYENVVFDRSVLSLPDEIDAEPREVPKKECPECGEENFIQATGCCFCGYLFEFQIKQVDRPTEGMVRVFHNPEQQHRFNYYRKMVQTAFKKGKSPEWADNKYFLKFGSAAPLDWRRNAIVQGAELQNEYKEYLYRVAATEGRRLSWVGEQLSLELGI